MYDALWYTRFQRYTTKPLCVCRYTQCAEAKQNIFPYLKRLAENLFISCAHTKGALCEKVCTTGAQSGKTLFTSMLNAYYDINAKDEFEALFKGTYIYDHPTEQRNHYYILKFDFSGLNTSDTDSLIQTFHNRVYSRCKAFLEQYQITIELEKGIDAADCLSQFLDRISVGLDSSIYVIVDE